MINPTFIIFLALLPFFRLVAESESEFFENRIRPVLAENCYECHNSIKQAKSGLVLDYKHGIIKGGERGPAISLTNPKSSLLLRVMKHEISNLKMPKGGPKITDNIIKDFESWISAGAFDPRDKPPTAEQFAQETSWEKIREKRKEWWSFQPVRKHEIPSVLDSEIDHPVDKFLRDKMHATGLSPNKPADQYTILRRLTFSLIGLPPSIEQQDRFSKLVKNGLDQAVSEFSDELLSSPHFGERWARHWMDWVRYADSHGSEGDPQIPNAYRYRNYLIRALNEDIGYDQLVKEHIAGDLLDNPRVNKKLGINESAIGTSHLRFVLHGFAPTDALDEHVRFTDDQIDTVTKTFLGLTVSCSRCHHHKFDAISHDDYYALFGIFSNGRPAQRVIDDPSNLSLYDNQLTELKNKIKNAITKHWQSTDFTSKILNRKNKEPSKDPHDFLMVWDKMESHNEKNSNAEWKKLEAQVKESKKRLKDFTQTDFPKSWNMGNPGTYNSWKKSGTGLKENSAEAGAFTLSLKGNKILEHIYPAGVYTHLLSTKENGTFSSPRFKFNEGNLWLRIIGDKGSSFRYSVWNYPRRGTVYPKSSPEPSSLKWYSFKTNYWAGETGYLEITTNRDHPVEAGNAERSWFGITDAVQTKPGQPNPRNEMAEVLSSLFIKPIKEINRVSLANRYSKIIKESIEAWRSNKISNEQSLILLSLLKHDLLPNNLNEIPSCRDSLEKYRELETKVPVPRLTPGILDGEPFDQALFERGNHKKPAHLVPRRFLEAIDETPYPKNSSGRLELATDLLREDNPFTTRVIVNRIWHHLFGDGIVRTPDNFGRLGEKPSHPELLDYLAIKFRNDEWSIKKMIRFLVTSETFRSSSPPSSKAKEIDPQNILLSHANLRRIEAEPIRDAMLLSSGRLQLDRIAEGKPEGKNSPRRSVYRQIKRNSLDTFLSVFDAPVPSSTKGRRDITNVPAQSLTLMNDPDVVRAAREFGNIHRTGNLKDNISKMFRIALGRPPLEHEISRSLEYLDRNDRNSQEIESKIASSLQNLDKINIHISKITEPVLKQILKERKLASNNTASSSPEPSLHWDFSQGLEDSILGIKCQLKSGAKLENGALQVRNGGYAVTERIPFDISEKTLSAWVKLDNLKQRAGGVISLQTPNGVLFDSIVYAEKQPYIWMSGSNSFRRTENFTLAPQEKQADKVFVHLVITYSKEGKITGYRNGKPYGKPYQKSTFHFKRNVSVISFGVRHLPASPQRLLNGEIKLATLFDRELSSDEIKALFDPVSHITPQEITKSFSAEEKVLFDKLSAQKVEIMNEIQGFERQRITDKPKLQDLALALFNMKEFIYLR